MVRLDHYDWKITAEMLKRPYHLVQSDVDGDFRKWQEFSYGELGLTWDSPDYEPKTWVCTGTYETKKEAILEHNRILRK